MSDCHPPAWITTILRKFCDPNFFEDVHGDLGELYNEDYVRKGKNAADFNYLLRVMDVALRFKKSNKSKRINNWAMFKSNLLFSFRYLVKQKFFTLVNVTSLVLGLTIVALVTLYVRHELSYDKHHHDSQNTYRLVSKRGENWFAFLSIPYSNHLVKNRYPEVVRMARFRRTPGRYVHFEDQVFPEDNILITDSKTEFFEVFKHDFLEGSAESALAGPNTVVITESTAQKYFGAETALGKLIQVDSILVKVDGVIKDVPSNSHIGFDLLVGHSGWVQPTSAATYLVLNEKAQIEDIKNRILTATIDELTPPYKISDLDFQNLPDIHLTSNLTFELLPPGNLNYVLMVAAIAGLVLIITIFNYVNLSIALNNNRRREIGTRRVLGANGQTITGQFMIEATILVLISFLAAILLTRILMPSFALSMGLNMDHDFLFSTTSLLWLAVIGLVTVMTAGFYPAMRMSKGNALNFLRKKKAISAVRFGIRKGLVLAQFVMLISLLAATLILDEQLGFMMTGNSGFKTEGILKVGEAWKLGPDRFQTLKTELLKHPGVITVADGYAPADAIYPLPYQLLGRETVYEDAIIFGVDHDYFQALSIKGRGEYFQEEEHPRVSLLVNQTMMDKLALQDHSQQTIVTSPGQPRERQREIRGVFDDFNYFSMHQEIPPMILIARETRGYVTSILIKIKMEEAQDIIASLEDTWINLDPMGPINHRFLDDDLQKLYEKESQLAAMGTNLSIVALALASIGLIGLTTFMLSVRIKEIGVRKVLGAKVSTLFWLLIHGFVSIIGIATLIASGLTWFLMESWLNNFAYRIEINPVLFLFAGLLTLIIAIVVISYRTIKAATANPVQALRYE